MSPKTPFALLATTALMAAGCGSDDASTLTKAQVIQRGSVICRAAEKRVTALPSPKSDNPFAKGTPVKERADAVRFLDGYANALDSTRLGLSKLDAPAEDRELLRDYITGISRVVAKLRAARHSQDIGTVTAAFALFDRVSAKTAAYGFPKGVCGSGEAS